MIKLISAALAGVIASAMLATAPAQAVIDLHPERDRVFIVAAGDSIVAGAGARKVESWPARLEVACAESCRVRNVGHGGSCMIAEGCNYATTLTGSFEAEVLDLEPDLVLVGIGRNDLCRTPTRTLIDGYRALRARSLAAGVPIRFATITPASAAWQWPCEDQRVEVNAWLRTLPGTMDFEARSSTPHGMLLGQFDYGDGLHMNARGYDVLGRMAARKVAPGIRQLKALRS